MNFVCIPPEEVEYEVGFDDQYPIPEGPEFFVSEGFSPKGWDSRCRIDWSSWSRKPRPLRGYPSDNPVEDGRQIINGYREVT